MNIFSLFTTNEQEGKFQKGWVVVSESMTSCKGLKDFEICWQVE